MDGRWSVWAIQHHQFEQVRGPIRTEHQVAEWILADLVDSQGVHQCVLMSSGSTPCRSADGSSSTTESYYETAAVPALRRRLGWDMSHPMASRPATYREVPLE